MIEYTEILSSPITFTSAFKVLLLEGNLVYEYNPFRNYRLSYTLFEYKNHIYTLEELNENFSITLWINSEEIKTSTDLESKLYSNLTWKWKQGDNELNISESPIIRRKGELVDFDTNELSFSLNHPVLLLPLYSYDGSVNLLINDGLNKPRLINSRFSPIGRNKYLIVDRKGNNDTNIYDLGDLFEIDTSLYKLTLGIPLLVYNGTFASGNLPIGNYHFYFRYADADGNETDFILESGLVSIFIGNIPQNIRSGFRNENSFKGVSFTLKNLDSGYLYLHIYYTRATSDIMENRVVEAKKIDLKFLITTMNTAQIKITGFEQTLDVSIDEINTLYFVASSVETQATCLNRLFLGNIVKPTIEYLELTDISLRFLPRISIEEYPITTIVSEDYSTGAKFQESYYNTKFIYNKVGYWPSEIYRFGIVYILKDYTLSPVFNVRGIKDVSTDSEYTVFGVYDDNNNRLYISYDEDTNLLTAATTTSLENCKGVINIAASSNKDSRNIYGITFELLDKDNCIKILQNMGILGYFFVRQKRIPTILCEAYVIGVDKESHTPVIPYNDEFIAESFLSNVENNYIKKKELTHEYKYRINKVSKTFTNKAAICPEYDVDSPYLNTLFTGDEFTIESLEADTLKRLYYEDRYYYTLVTSDKHNTTSKCNIIGVEDNVKLVGINETYFSARAGEAEEAFRYEYIKYENKITDATNLVRGSFGPYIGLTNCPFDKLISIRIPNYNYANIKDYFTIRYNDKSAYYAIGDRKELSNLINTSKDVYYRGDSYICLYTHRVNRNFQDPTAPLNDKIVDKNCWKNNYEVKDNVLQKDKFDKINLGDVNAVQLGQWITFVVRSNMNLNVRAIDGSITDEVALTGHERTFYPYSPFSLSGVYKVPEALCYNKGFEQSLSERYNFEVPDIPAIKNEFSNRIAYSDVFVNDAFLNGFRVFYNTYYRDYPKTYGSITKLLEWNGNLVCVLEHGIYLIPINERTVAGEGDGGYAYINTDNVLPLNPNVLSDKYGSLWKESVIKTPLGIYGVDTVAKKIWYTNGSQFLNISDFNVQEFLNQNISLIERELDPIIGIRNVKSHYNAFKLDVLFTFYDNLYGFEEKVWNLCWNEQLQKFITFYSWVPSYSENIFNQYFSFDRNTSKWISKLGVSRKGSDFADGVCLSNNIVDSKLKVVITDITTYPSGYELTHYPVLMDSSEDLGMIQIRLVLLRPIIGTLSLENRNIPKEDDNIKVTITFELVHDNFGNYKKFLIVESNGKSYLISKVPISDLCSEYYIRGNDTTSITDVESLKQEWLNNCVYKYKSTDAYDILKEENGAFKMLDTPYNSDLIVYLLNIRANVTIELINEYSTYQEALVLGFYNSVKVDSSYYESTVAVIPDYNMLFLTTDFWKHGQGGIIDIADNINPAFWYGKQHPFEFEFVINDAVGVHKIFDSLQLISNNAEPESFHYEITGDCFEFADDKKNMYIRLEATKELLQYNGSNITFDREYTNLKEEHRKCGIPEITTSTYYDRSTILPAYYYRQDTINEIEDSYHSLTDSTNTKNFSLLSGGEIVYYKTLDEYRLWIHTPAIDMKKLKQGLMRGNMLYKEDRWNILLNPINYILRNETDRDWMLRDENWNLKEDSNLRKVPVVYNAFKEMDVPKSNNLQIPSNWNRNIVSSWNIGSVSQIEALNKQVNIKDKWMKVRIRYKGNKLAIIHSIQTLFRISYA